MRTGKVFLLVTLSLNCGPLGSVMAAETGGLDNSVQRDFVNISSNHGALARIVYKDTFCFLRSVVSQETNKAGDTVVTNAAVLLSTTNYNDSISRLWAACLWLGGDTPSIGLRQLTWDMVMQRCPSGTDTAKVVSELGLPDKCDSSVRIGGAWDGIYRWDMVYDLSDGANECRVTIASNKVESVVKERMRAGTKRHLKIEDWLRAKLNDRELPPLSDKLEEALRARRRK